MTLIARQVGVGDRPHRVTLQAPGPPISDGDGGFTQTWTDLVPPAVSANIAPATARDLERVAAGTVISTATHIVTCPYHPQITTKTRIVFGSRFFSVVGVANPDERNVESICLCVEIVS